MFMLQICRSTREYVNRDEKRGFTLVELAIVLIIVGLIIGTLTPVMMAIIKRDKLKEARDIIIKARNEIVGYAMTNNETLPGSVDDIGHSKDPWGNDLFMIVAPNLVGTDVCNEDSANMSIDFYVPDGSGSCAYSKTVEDVACIIGSKGEDYNRQVSDLDDDNVVTILDYGCQGDLYSSDDSGLSAQRPFDDIYDYLTLDELKARLCGCDTSSSSRM